STRSSRRGTRFRSPSGSRGARAICTTRWSSSAAAAHRPSRPRSSCKSRPARSQAPGYAPRMKVAPILYGDRQGYTVSALNRGVARFRSRLPSVWVEGEVTELRRNEAWANVFVTLKDPKTSACLKATIPRRVFDALELDLGEGETVHVEGRAELYEARGE